MMYICVYTRPVYFVLCTWDVCCQCVVLCVFTSMLFTRCVRGRYSLLPGVSKGWSASNFPSVGKALEFAMASKRMKMSWLSQGTRIPISRLKAATLQDAKLEESEVKKIEMYIGVSLR